MNLRPTRTVRSTTRSTRPAARPTIRTAGVAAVLVALPLGLSACSGDAEAEAADPTSSETSLAQVQEETGVPDECREAFPAAIGPADPAEVSLMPTSWPDDAVAATLCQTSATGSGIQVASYATSADRTEVLDAVQGALPATWTVTREDQGMGEQLDGTGEGVSFRVTTREGAFDVMFVQE